MTKIRHALTPEDALMYALGALTPSRAALITGFSEAYLRACSDPDNKRGIPFQSAVELDMTLKAEGKKTPFFDLMRAVLREQASACKDTDVTASLLDVLEDVAQLSAVVRSAMDAASPGGGSVHAVERAAINKQGQEIIREVQELLDMVNAGSVGAGITGGTIRLLGEKGPLQ